MMPTEAGPITRVPCWRAAWMIIAASRRGRPSVRMFTSLICGQAIASRAASFGHVPGHRNQAGVDLRVGRHGLGDAVVDRQAADRLAAFARRHPGHHVRAVVDHLQRDLSCLAFP